MNLVELTAMLERLGALGLLAIFGYGIYRLLDKHGTRFGDTLSAIQGAIADNSKQEAERHQKILENLAVVEKTSTDEVMRQMTDFRKEVSDALRDLKDFRTVVRSMSPGTMPAVRDTRRDR